MFFALSKTLDVLLSPLTWAMLLALAALHPRHLGLRRWGPVASALCLYGFSMEPVSNALTTLLERDAVRTFREDTTYDAVILLGGVVEQGPTRTHGVPSYNDNVERLLVTFDLLRTGRARRALLSGGRAGPDDPVSEARTLGDQLVAWGIERDRLDLEEESRNTRENATFSRRIAVEHRYGRLLLVTSAFHMARAEQCFSEAGLGVDTLPVDFRSSDAHHTGSLLPRAEDLARSTAAIRELAGRWIYVLAGYAKR